MSILQPLLDLQQSHRIECEKLQAEITKLQKLEASPLNPCGFCQVQHAKLISYPDQHEPGQHSIVVRCGCGIQTIPQRCFENEPVSFYSAIYDAIQIWNGEHA